MNSLSQEIAEFVVEMRFEDLPEAVVHEAKRSFLDAIGCAIAGIATEKGKISVALARRLGGPSESSIIGMGDKVSCCNAAFANGELINALDYDALPHVQPFVIPPALAAAESAKASGRDLILAIVLAEEISKRLSMALRGTMIQKLMKDLETPAVWGNGHHCIFGAAAGAGKILRLNRQKMTHALGIAGYLAPVPYCGKWDRIAPKPIIKYAPIGWICSSAVNAVLIADMGYTGDPTVFDGDYGFWRFYSSESWNPDLVMDQLGKKWLFTDILYKFYPCCSFFCTQLDCFRSIIDKNNLVPEEIESVNVLSAPFFASPNPMEVTNQVDAQFSPPYVIAVAAHRVKVGRDWQDFDTIRDKSILGFMKKVNFQVHPGVADAKRKDPRSWLAKVEVMAKGKVFTEERMYPKGTNGTDFKATDEELVEKFRGNASGLLTQDKIDRVIRSLLDLERVENISEITEQFTL